MRKRPTPSAPAATARTASAGEPMFAATSIVVPSIVRAGSSAEACASRSATSRSSRAVVSSARSDSSGSTWITPVVPSTTRGVPSAMASSASPAPTTAGIPDARASTAACDVGPPAAVAIPSATAGSSPTVSAGDRSLAITTPGASSAGWGTGTPSRCASTWRPTLRRSAARARRYSSSRPSHPSAVRSITSCQARAAEMPSSTIERFAGVRSASSFRKSRCASKISASSAPARPATRARWPAISSRTWSSAASNAATSTSAGPAPWGIGRSGVRNRLAGPIPIPGEAG